MGMTVGLGCVHGFPRGLRANPTVPCNECTVRCSLLVACEVSVQQVKPFLDAAFLLAVGSFLLTVELLYLQLTILAFFTCNWSFFAYSFSFSTYSWSFSAYSGKVRLIRALRDCKQRSLTVSKKAPTVSEKAPPCAPRDGTEVVFALLRLMTAARNGSNAAKTGVCASQLSTEQCEHPLV